MHTPSAKLGISFISSDWRGAEFQNVTISTASMVSGNLVPPLDDSVALVSGCGRAERRKEGRRNEGRGIEEGRKGWREKKLRE
jgi:hypothetical protein